MPNDFCFKYLGASRRSSASASSVENHTIGDTDTDDPQFHMDEKPTLSSSNSSMEVSEKCTNNHVTESVMIPPNSTKNFVESNNESNNEGSQNLFWNDVTSRAKALSNPSSFQRPRAHHY